MNQPVFATPGNGPFANHNQGHQPQNAMPQYQTPPPGQYPDPRAGRQVHPQWSQDPRNAAPQPNQANYPPMPPQGMQQPQQGGMSPQYQVPQQPQGMPPQGMPPQDMQQPQQGGMSPQYQVPQQPQGMPQHGGMQMNGGVQQPNMNPMQELTVNCGKMSTILANQLGLPVEAVMGPKLMEMLGMVPRQQQAPRANNTMQSQNNGVFVNANQQQQPQGQDAYSQMATDHDYIPPVTGSRRNAANQQPQPQGQPQQPQPNQQPQQPTPEPKRNVVMESLEPDGTYVDNRTPQQVQEDIERRKNRSRVQQRFHKPTPPPQTHDIEWPTNNGQVSQAFTELANEGATSVKLEDVAFKQKETRAGDVVIQAEAHSTMRPNDVGLNFHKAYDFTKHVNFYINLNDGETHMGMPIIDQKLVKMENSVEYLNHELDPTFYRKSVETSTKEKIQPRFDMVQQLQSLPEADKNGDIEDFEKFRCNEKPVVKDTTDFAFSMEQAMFQRDLWHHNNDLSEASVAGNNEFYYENVKAFLLFDSDEADDLRIWLLNAEDCSDIGEFQEMLNKGYETLPERIWHVINDNCTSAINNILRYSAGEVFKDWKIDSFAVDWKELVGAFNSVDPSGETYMLFENRFKQEVILGGLRMVSDGKLESFAASLGQNFAASETDVKRSGIVLTQLHSVTQLNARAADFNLKLDNQYGSVVLESVLPELHKAITSIERRVNSTSPNRNKRVFIRTLDNYVMEVHSGFFNRGHKVLRRVDEKI